MFLSHFKLVIFKIVIKKINFIVNVVIVLFYY